jgi:hypothetical protein
MKFCCAQAKTGVMQLAREKWGPLKVGQMKPLFEVADIQHQEERLGKRPKR